MQENQLIARQKRHFKRTTDSERGWTFAPDLVAQDVTSDDP
jgi:putative transposase